ncbi:glycosyltransferase [Blastococcus atacamensis]|uniref:glycosyltransferase n=1 Tax=Blastococcus atacamensis TaxID=2070508 RepID=UPI000CEC0459|nr:glycosyltransferase [Blastococcus atacamensis]
MTGSGGTWCCEWELADSSPPRGVTPSAGSRTARVLVRLHGDPLGYLTLPSAEAAPEALLPLAEAAFGERIAAHLAEEGLVASRPYPAAGAGCPNRVDGAELVTVVVCTRGRAGQLAGCLGRLRELTYPRLEILVVDNAPSDDSTRRVVDAVAAADPRFRYVVEPRPGLSRARNRGLVEARGRWLAYTDDDVSVDPRWVDGLVRGFRQSPDVGCVTGLVATAEISGAAEEYFDARAASWSTRCEPQLFALGGAAADDPLFPYSPGVFGTGADMAFDREHLLALGGFDEALGAGTLTRGGEDLDIFVRVLRAGRAIAYSPAALVWHHHRADDAGLLRQMFGYGTGLSAFMTKCLLQAGTRREVLVRVPLGLRRMTAIRSTTEERLTEATAAPRGAMLQELLGLLAGPVLYLRARRAARVAPGGGR